MILVTEIDGITEWLNENRPDQGSEIPYFIATETDFGFELPDDRLIVKGLDELGIVYLRFVNVGNARLASTNNSDYNDWEARFDAVNACKELVNNSPLEIEHPTAGTLPLRDMIVEWYENAMYQVNNFILTGDAEFLRMMEEGTDFWWEMGNPTVRQQGVELIQGLVIHSHSE